MCLVCLCMHAYKEWLSGSYSNSSHSETYGYPTPSLRVLVDVVEHQAGGAHPALAKDLAKRTFSHGSTVEGSGLSNYIDDNVCMQPHTKLDTDLRCILCIIGDVCEPSSSQADQSPSTSATTEHTHGATAKKQRFHGNESR